MPFLPIVASSSSEKSRAPHNERPQSYIILRAVKKIVYYIRPRNRRYYYYYIIHIYYCVGNPSPVCIYTPVAALVLLLYPGRLCDASVSVRVRRRARESCIYIIIIHIKEKKGPMRFLFLLRSTRILSRAKIRRTFGAFPASGWHIPSEFHVYIYIPFSALFPRSPPSQFSCMWCFHPKKEERSHTMTHVAYGV